jgi:hypothetical protein
MARVRREARTWRTSRVNRAEHARLSRAKAVFGWWRSGAAFRGQAQTWRGQRPLARWRQIGGNEPCLASVRIKSSCVMRTTICVRVVTCSLANSLWRCVWMVFLEAPRFEAMASSLRLSNTSRTICTSRLESFKERAIADQALSVSRAEPSGASWGIVPSTPGLFPARDSVSLCSALRTLRTRRRFNHSRKE